MRHSATTLLALTLLAGLSASAAAQPASVAICLRQPTFPGCPPVASAPTRDTVVQVTQGDAVRRMTIGQLLGQMVPGDVMGALGFTPLSSAALAGKADVSAVAGKLDATGDGSGVRVSLGSNPSARLDALLAGTALITGQQIAGNPTIATCPVGNCPPVGTNTGFGGAWGGPTLSAGTIYGRSTPDQHPQFQFNVGLYVKDGGNSGGKGQYVASYAGSMQGPGAGATWALNTVSIRGACAGGPNSMFGQPGSGIPFGDTGCSTAPGSLGNNTTIGYELDHSNFDADSVTHGAFSVGLYINTLSKYTSGAGITFGNSAGQDSTTVPGSWHHGIEFAPNTVADASIYDVSNGPFSYLTSGTHGIATFQDDSTGPAGLKLNGLKTVADIVAASNSPAVLSMTGTHSAAGIYDNSSGPAALKVDGSHSVASVVLGGTSPAALTAAGTFGLAAITTAGATTPIALHAAPGQKVCFNGIYNCIQYNTAAGKFYFTNNANVIKASLDNSGNMILSGTLTQNGTP